MKITKDQLKSLLYSYSDDRLACIIKWAQDIIDDRERLREVERLVAVQRRLICETDRLDKSLKKLSLTKMMAIMALCTRESQEKIMAVYSSSLGTDIYGKTKNGSIYRYCPPEGREKLGRFYNLFRYGTPPVIRFR